MGISKQDAIELFKSQVIGEYTNYRKNIAEFPKIVGDVVGISQDLERELDKVSKKSKDGKRTIRENFFDVENDEQKDKTNKELLEIKKCRNYVIHNCFREYYDKQIKTTENDLFVQFVESTNLIKAWVCVGRERSGGINELKENIKQDWKGENGFIDFNTKEKLYTNTSINIKQDWVALKVIMTKHLMYEFLDRLNKNQCSIFA
jgi:hypothetical protein